jgi:hypothetical protein
MDEYHIRSMVEAVFSSIKRCWGPDIKSIKGWLKRRELAIKVLAYNIKRVLYIDFWDEALCCRGCEEGAMKISRFKYNKNI